MKTIAVLLLLTGLSRAVQVYLNPPLPLPSTLDTTKASFALSRHLGLDAFEFLGTHGESPSDLLDEQEFVGQGAHNSLLLSIDEDVTRGRLELEHVQYCTLDPCLFSDVLPSSLKQSFSLSTTHSVPTLSSLISTCLHRARHVYSSVHASFSHPKGTPRLLDLFSVSTPSTDTFLAELSVLSEFLDDPTTSEKFAALELTGLSKIAQAFGRMSNQYTLAAEATHAMLESALSQPNLHLALLTFTSDGSHHGVDRRETEPPGQTHLPVPNPIPQQPISGISTCFATEDDCAVSTKTCSGRGQCVKASKAGRTCFVCACSMTVSEKGKKETWVGNACERKDVSGWVHLTLSPFLHSKHIFLQALCADHRDCHWPCYSLWSRYIPLVQRWESGVAECATSRGFWSNEGRLTINITFVLLETVFN